jgi:hypothetical protein
VLAAFIEAQLRGRRPEVPRLRISQAGDECLRRVYYQATGAPRAADDAIGLVKMGLGSAFDEWTLRPAEGVRIQVPVTIVAGALTLTGKADAVFGDPAELVADLKTVGNGTWARVQKRPADKHAAQVNLYAWGLGAPRNSICYVNADTGEILEHVRDTDGFAAEEDLGLFEMAHYYRASGREPVRPYMDITEDDGTVKIAKDRWPCRWCAYSEHCWRP